MGGSKQAAAKRRKQQEQAYIAKKLKKDERAEVMQRLAQSSLNKQGQGLMMRSGRLGQKETRREEEERLERRKSAGLQQPGQDLAAASHGPRLTESTPRMASSTMSMAFKPIERRRQQQLSSSGESESDEDLFSESEDDETGKEDLQSTNNVPESTLEASIETVQSDASSTGDKPELSKVNMTSHREEDERDEENEEGRVAALPILIGEDKLKYVAIERPADVQGARLKLPMLGGESAFLDALRKSDVVLVTGQTGSGKTTQVPQFLLEAGYGRAGLKVLVTQPRRVAAVSTAVRVGEELGGEVGYRWRDEAGREGSTSGWIGYKVRHDSREDATKNRALFVTDGLALRMLLDDPLLKAYDAVVLDEAHERNVNTDVLIGLLSRVIRHRRMLHDSGDDKADIPALKVIIMSATLRVSDFRDNESLWGPAVVPPLVHVPGRTFPLTVHFARKTPVSIAEMELLAIKRVKRIHAKAPLGGHMLIFVTGVQEVNRMVAALKDYYGQVPPSQSALQAENADRKHAENAEMGINMDDSESGQSFEGVMKVVDKTGDDRARSAVVVCDGDTERANLTPEEETVARTVEETEAKLFQAINEDEDSRERQSSALEHDDSDYEGETLDEQEEAELAAGRSRPIRIMPLYSMLPVAEQMRIFEACQDRNTRLVIVSTNVAETSLTLPHIRYVIDSGRVKGREDDRYVTRWISQAAAAQRAGRAGRMGPGGQVYRLYSAAMFEDVFEPFEPPQILTVPLTGVYLSLKALLGETLDVARFPFPTKPDRDMLVAAGNELCLIGACIKTSGDRSAVALSRLGERMAMVPVSPRWSRLLFSRDGSVTTKRLSLWPFLVPLVALLSLGSEPVVQGDLEAAQRRRRTFGGPSPSSDHLLLLALFGAFLATPEVEKPAFCARFGAVLKWMKEAERLMEQLFHLLDACLGGASFKAYLRAPKAPPAVEQSEDILRIFLEAFPDQVAFLNPEDALYKILSFGPVNNTFSTAALHNGSLLYGKKSLPATLLYLSISKTSLTLEQALLKEGLESAKQDRQYLRTCSLIKPEWLVDTLAESISCCYPSFASIYGPEISNKLCTVGPVLPQPVPAFSAQEGDLFAHAQLSYGGLVPVLPPARLPLAQALYLGSGKAALLGTQSIFLRLIAMHILDGTLDGRFKALLPLYASPPILCLKTNLALPKVVSLLQSLSALFKIPSSEPKPLDVLKQQWNISPSWLKREIMAWLPSDAHQQLDSIWPPSL